MNERMRWLTSTATIYADGHGFVITDDTIGIQRGDVVAVVDAEAAMFEAVVLSVDGERVTFRLA